MRPINNGLFHLTETIHKCDCLQKDRMEMESVPPLCWITSVKTDFDTLFLGGLKSTFD